MASEAIITRAKILEVAQGLPAAPRVFADLERILADPEASLEHVAEAIKRDTAMAAQVIRLSNSAALGADHRVGSVEEAVLRVGHREVFRIAGYIAGPNAAMVAGLGAFLGHLFPVWLKFKGGKGVAVYIGILLGLFWPGAVVFCLIWLATAFTTRYSSLSALVAAFVTPMFLWWFGHLALAALTALLTLLTFYAHRENIKRLLNGTENKFVKKTPPAA